jgi:hypothetical protein
MGGSLQEGLPFYRGSAHDAAQLLAAQRLRPLAKRHVSGLGHLALLGR